MKIGVIGCGVVGGTILKGYLTLGFKTVGYDKFKEGFNDFDKILDTDVIFICLPTVVDEKTGQMNMEPFEETFPKLKDYKGLVIIKSTVLPGTTKQFSIEYPAMRLVHSPEFLTEKNAMIDFFKPDRIVVGITETIETKDLDPFFEIHNIFNSPIIATDTNTSEFMKFMSNSFFATKISFANEMNEIAQFYGADYNKAKEIFYMDRRVGADHLSINKERAYGGMCLPKDVNQLLADLKSKKIIPCVLSTVKQINDRKNKLEKM